MGAFLEECSTILGHAKIVERIEIVAAESAEGMHPVRAFSALNRYLDAERW